MIHLYLTGSKQPVCGAPIQVRAGEPVKEVFYRDLCAICMQWRQNRWRAK